MSVCWKICLLKNMSAEKLSLRYLVFETSHTSILEGLNFQSVWFMGQCLYSHCHKKRQSQYKKRQSWQSIRVKFDIFNGFDTIFLWFATLLPSQSVLLPTVFYWKKLTRCHYRSMMPHSVFTLYLSLVSEESFQEENQVCVKLPWRNIKEF